MGVKPGNTPAPGQENDSSLIDRLLEELELFRLVFDSIYCGAMVTDAEGYITHFNTPYGEFLGLNPEAQIGKHCTEVIENTRMHIVAKTGRPEINHVHRIKGQDMVVQRIPIKKDGKVIAVFGQVMFRDVKDVERLARKISHLESELKLYKEELLALRSTRYTFESIKGTSPAIESLKKEAIKATANDLPVLITGESGTGKELFAQAIHHGSARRMFPFVRINCSAIPQELFESELFGYEKGAFTGARSTGKPGKVEIAHRGTLFLDEVADLPLSMQPKLLRVLEEKEFERVGGTKLLKSNFRVIAATNQDLERLIEENRFRKDLYYRLNVIHLHIPPLRKRKQDILVLAEHYLKELRDYYVRPVTLSERAKEALLRYHWPGNTRELINALEKAMISVEGDVIELENLPFYLQKEMTKPFMAKRNMLKTTKLETEKQLIMDALKSAKNNKAEAARLLGIHRTLLYKKIKAMGIKI